MLTVYLPIWPVILFIGYIAHWREEKAMEVGKLHVQAEQIEESSIRISNGIMTLFFYY
jgi:hypothetical protein